MFFDLFDIPSSDLADVKTFSMCSAYQVWNRPRGRTMAYIILIGPGGGGAGGTSGGSIGGGGGGSGAITRCLIPLFALPEAMTVIVGTGGLGGAANTNGSGSFATALYNNSKVATNATDVILSASAGAAGLANGTGGAGGAIATDSICLGSGLGINQYTAGQNGAAGGSSSVGSDVTMLTTRLPVTGGAGGGGSALAGGQILNNSSSVYPTLPGGAGGSPTFSQGNKGLLFLRPFFSTGGSGAGGRGSVLAGIGGDGATGSGGGGGGASSGGSGNSGGRGGDGLVVIICW